MRATICCLLLTLFASAQAQNKIPVELDVSAADSVTATKIRRQFASSLGALDDVEIVDWQGRFKVQIIVVELRVSQRIDVGYALSTVVTAPFPPDNVQSLVEPDMQDYAALLMEGAVEIKDHWIKVVTGSEFEAAMQDIVDQVDLQVLGPYREELGAE